MSGSRSETFCIFSDFCQFSKLGNFSENCNFQPFIIIFSIFFSKIMKIHLISDRMTPISAQWNKWNTLKLDSKVETPNFHFLSKFCCCLGPFKNHVDSQGGGGGQKIPDFVYVLEFSVGAVFGNFSVRHRFGKQTGGSVRFTV